MQIVSHVRYLLSPRLFWYSATLLMLTGAAVVGQREPSIRGTGTILQLIGTVVVLNELRSALRVFGGFDWKADVAKFFHGWPRKNKSVQPASCAVDVSLPMPYMVGSMHSTMPAGAPMGARVAHLEQLIGAIFQQMANIRVEIKDEAAARADVFGEATRHAEGLVSRLRDQVAEVTAGSPWMSIFGIGWLAVGVVLGGTAPDWANWLA